MPSWKNNKIKDDRPARMFVILFGFIKFSSDFPLTNNSALTLFSLLCTTSYLLKCLHKKYQNFQNLEYSYTARIDVLHRNVCSTNSEVESYLLVPLNVVEISCCIVLFSIKYLFWECSPNHWHWFHLCGPRFLAI